MPTWLHRSSAKAEFLVSQINTARSPMSSKSETFLKERMRIGGRIRRKPVAARRDDEPPVSAVQGVFQLQDELPSRGALARILSGGAARSFSAALLPR